MASSLTEKPTTTQQSTIQIPDFLADWRQTASWPSPYPPTRHPDSDYIKSESESWLRSYCCTSSTNPNSINKGINDLFISKIIAGDFPEIACLIYAHQPTRHVLLAALVMLHFFVIDEFTDNVENTVDGERQVRRQSAAMVRAFRHPEEIEVSSATGEYKEVWVGVRMAADIALRYRSDAVGGTSDSWDFFVDSFAEYLDGVGDEVALRRKVDGKGEECVPSREGYIAVRRLTIGVLPGMALLLIDRAIRPNFLQIPAVDSLLRLCVDIIINQNDIYSFDKEQAKGEDGHNGVRVLMEEDGVGVQEAMTKLGQETKVLVRDFVGLVEDSPTLENEVDGTNLRILRDGCVSWILGMEVWSTLVTKRYGMQRLDGERRYTPTPKKVKAQVKEQEQQQKEQRQQAPLAREGMMSLMRKLPGDLMSLLRRILGM
ncbi:isoprenoid synthase domain-containing protein [Colletotrichum godetiae]|uniref:Terpene synthase n=1 Tax=Colletotrichum godetiae TaxID=1209918 RepID=A0AAJ0AX73_9PEZI|nr:isoprenoid synthase domain-containing protein [Colletotrichum godetiae]KAK1699903.1 isoprenoid synthase domain-containing protein [Colletotrichum godetiae]